MHGENVIPAPLDDDDDDVAWALQTAAVQWQRGAHADAVVWVRRAVEAAIAAGSAERTKDLTQLAASVANRLVSEAMAAPDSMVPPRASEPAQADDVDALLSVAPALPLPPARRASAHSLTNEIPVDFEDDADIDDDEFGDEAPTIPPSSGPEPPGVEAGFDSLASPPPSRDAIDPPDAAISAWPQDSTAEVTADELIGPRPGEPALSVSPDELFSSRPGEAALSVSPDELFSSRPGEATLSVSPDELFSSRPPGSASTAGVDEPFGSLPPASTAGVDEPFGSRPPEPPGIAPAEAATDAPVESVEPPPPASVKPPAPASVEPPPPAEPSPWAGESQEDKAPPLPDDEQLGTESGEVPTSAVDGVPLDQVRGFEDLPEENQISLASSAELTRLSADEEVGSFGAALVTRGRVGIMPSIAEVAASVAVAGEVVFTRGTLDEGIALRVVALEDDTVVASWSAEQLQAGLADCPWVADELRLVADRFQALAGATLGPLGDRFDDALRNQVVSRLDVKAFAPGELIVAVGKPVPGLHVVGAGRVEFVEGEAVIEVADPGDFLFAAEVLAGGRAHATARAGKSGALILFATRAVAHELLMVVPPLLEILAG
jgi:hypothetical protein